MVTSYFLKIKKFGQPAVSVSTQCRPGVVNDVKPLAIQFENSAKIFRLWKMPFMAVILSTNAIEQPKYCAPLTNMTSWQHLRSESALHALTYRPMMHARIIYCKKLIYASLFNYLFFFGFLLYCWVRCIDDDCYQLYDYPSIECITYIIFSGWKFLWTKSSHKQLGNFGKKYDCV